MSTTEYDTAASEVATATGYGAANDYDIIIIGAGLAGLSAAIYTSRSNRRTLVIEKALPGGQIALTAEVENYPGFEEGIMGPELGEKLERQAARFGTQVLVTTEVAAIDLGDHDNPGALKRVVTADGQQYTARALILAMGAEHRKLGAPGEDRLASRGVSYCAVCDGAFFRNQTVVVVGGGDSALDEGLFLTKYAAKVVIVHRRAELRASKILQKRAFQNPKVEFIWDTAVTSINGQDTVESVGLRNLKTGEERDFPCQGVFIYVGYHPQSDLVKDVLELDDDGYICTDVHMRTNLPGVFAIGDLRTETVRQAATAAGDGVVAALAADEYLNTLAD
jgi:thioredoxin reductase (NADPH)